MPERRILPEEAATFNLTRRERRGKEHTPPGNLGSLPQGRIEPQAIRRRQMRRQHQSGK